MRLKSFHVRTFRNVVDSGPIRVDEVTCLVGKNEAGKSALLEALHHLNPAKPSAALDLLHEYPRWLLKQHQRSGEVDSAIPISAVFELTDDEVAVLEENFGVGIIASNEVTVSRGYATSAQLGVEADIHTRAFLDPFIQGLGPDLMAAAGTVSTSDQLLKTLKDIASAPSTDDNPVSLADQAKNALEGLRERFGTSPHLTAAVKAQLRSLVPRTFYFSKYAQLVGRYAFDAVLAAVTDGSSREEIQAAADFLSLAEADVSTMSNWEYEAANAELEGVSSMLTQQVKEHWRQNRHLMLRVTLEHDRSDENEVQRYLQFRVEDTRHHFTSRLDRRSTGFRWFVSFLASFLEFETDQNLILLLDEPGLSLHARAQMDLLDTIENKLARDRQVLYSTHSPFMVRTAGLKNTRIVEDKGPELGSVAENEAGIVSDPDTLFPLQAALGYDVVQNLFIGSQNILVEGISDFIYLSVLSDHLKTLGRQHLPESHRFLPAGGATNIPTFIALLGGKLDFVVLLDGDVDDQKIRNTIKKGRLDKAQIVSLSSFSKVKGADIEDLFTPGEYLKLYNRAFSKKLTLKQLKGTDRIVNRIARKDGEFNHGVVAADFVRNLDASLKGLSSATLDRFEAVLGAVAKALGTKP